VPEQTLVLIKPDGVQRGLVGEIIHRLENRGLKLAGIKMLQMTESIAKEHYAEHLDKPFFKGLSAFMMSRPLVALALEGDNAVEIVRASMGSTNPQSAAPGTIRGDLGINIGRNLIHGSDSREAADRELKIFFGTGEILNYVRDIDCWISE